MTRTRRAQILMEPAEYRRLERLAHRMKTTVSDLIRSAVEATYFRRGPEGAAIVDRIAAMNLPVENWDDLGREMEAAHSDGLP